MAAPKNIHIHIPDPCSQNWDEMKPCGGGRFCDHCQKTVVDFTEWSDGALYNFLAKNKEGVCGRFLSTQIDRPITLPYQPHSRLYRMTVALGLTLVLVANDTGFAQTKKEYVVSGSINIIPSQKLAIEQLFPSSEESGLFELISGIEGYIFQNDKLTPGVRIQVSQHGIEIVSGTSNFTGHYKLLIPQTGYYDVLFLADGCDSIQITGVHILQNRKIIQNVTMPFAAIENEMGIVSNAHIKSSKRAFSYQTIRKLPLRK